MVDNLFAHAITLITQIILENDSSIQAQISAVHRRCGETIRSIYNICKEVKDQEDAFIDSIFNFVWGLIPFADIVGKIGSKVFEAIATEGLDQLKSKINGVVRDGLITLENPKSISALKNFVNNKFPDEQVIKLNVKEAENRGVLAIAIVNTFTGAPDSAGNE